MVISGALTQPICRDKADTSVRLPLTLSLGLLAYFANSLDGGKGVLAALLPTAEGVKEKVLVLSKKEAQQGRSK